MQMVQTTRQRRAQLFTQAIPFQSLCIADVEGLGIFTILRRR